MANSALNKVHNLLGRQERTVVSYKKYCEVSAKNYTL